MFKFALIPISLLALVGCTKDGESDTADDSDTDIDLPGEPAINLNWTADDVTVELENITTGGFDFGMAETIDMDNGWFGEDCLNGTLTYMMCHEFMGLSGTLDSMYAEITADPPTKGLDDIEEGVSTLFDSSFHPNRLTYVVTVDDGSCWVWGQDTSYYTSVAAFADCEVVMP